MIRIGLSCGMCIGDQSRAVFNGRELFYMEASMVAYLMQGEVLPCLIPRNTNLRNFMTAVDGLLLQGGSDVSPRSYGEEPLREEWAGDYERDVYEVELIKIALELDKPILGICRGAQILNVAMGGDLYQDLESQKGVKHRDPVIYSKLYHEVKIAGDSPLAKLYPESGQINSVHHQGIKRVAADLKSAAHSPDGVVEALNLKGHGGDRYCLGVQWHPEFQTETEAHLLSPEPLLQDFLQAVRIRKGNHVAGS